MRRISDIVTIFPISKANFSTVALLLVNLLDIVTIFPSSRGSHNIRKRLLWLIFFTDLDEFPLRADVAVAAPDDVDVALTVKLLSAALLPVGAIVLSEAEINHLVTRRKCPSGTCSGNESNARF